MDAAELIADLDDDQRRAVTTESRLVAVIAGAGSGKTRVLTRRVAYRVLTGTADEARTLVLTFTREAAGELRRRLPRLGLAGRCTTGTFHSVALRMLQQRWRDRDERPWSVDDRRRLLRRLLRDVWHELELDVVAAEIDWASARLLDGRGYVDAVRRGDRHAPLAPDRLADLLDRFADEKQRARVLDVDDILARTIQAIRRDPVFADVVRWQHRHVLVDEAQDLNPLQHQLLEELRAGRDDLFLVGDPAQAIYGFNGADPGLLIDVSSRFPGVEIIRLPTNHRSTPQVVATGAHALRADGQPTGVGSARADGTATVFVAHDDERAEALGLSSIATRLDPALVRTGGVAVLARTNAQLPPIAAALTAAGVPTRRLVNGEAGGVASLLQHVFRLADPHDLRRWAQNALEGSDPDRPGDELTAEEEVGRAVLEFLRSHPVGTGAELRTWVDAADPFGRATSGVELLTFHAAKGREWHTVLLAGCETGLVPHRSATTAVGRAEEARLLYVACTRATDRLIVSWARRRGGYQRKLTPLLDGFTSVVPEAIAPPLELTALHRSPREVRLDRLRTWRADAARQGGVLPEALVTDAGLAAIAERCPATADELDAVAGLGTITSRRLFPGIRAALVEA